MFIAKPRQKKHARPPPPSKKRKAEHTIEVITFDEEARADYLTGFRKRKQARIKHAQEVAEQKARQDKMDMRRQIREDRRKEVEDHVQMVQKLLREAEQAGQDEEVQPETDDEEWTGIPDTVPEELPVDMEEEYIDEDRYTTVTVETVTLDRDGLHKIVGAMVTGGEEEQVDASDQHKKSSSGRESKAQKDRSADRPKKKKKFRYETKVERRISERKQRMKGART